MFAPANSGAGEPAQLAGNISGRGPRQKHATDAAGAGLTRAR